MDKYEYKLHSEEILKLIEEEKYIEAANIADKIDWRRVKSISMLLRVAALYRVNRRNEDSRAVLLLAYDRYPTNRSVVYSLCEVSIELDDVVAAIEYYKEFVKLAPRDNGVYTLRYRILEAQEASLEERIGLLEELKKRDYQEEWAYELAYLYHRVGLATKCVEECDDLILWFGDGPYVTKAMELKMLHAPLTPIQQKKYDMVQMQLQGEVVEEQPYYEDENPESDDIQEAYAEDSYGDTGYEGDTSYTDDVYADNSYAEDSYRDEGLAYEEPVQKQTTGSLDMSQYNTINLQKVVAESMRELFPEDEDVFSEEWTEVSAEETDKEDAVPVPVAVRNTNTGRVAAMVTGVSEVKPEPDTGAISKVIVPGNDARVIKQDVDMEEIRNVTEEYVKEEQERMEENQENVYEEPVTALPEEILPQQEPQFTPMTGQMNLDEVLNEWERMKKEVQEKRKEEVKQNVLRQTGQIFQNFDEAVKTGILGELGEEEVPVRTETFIENEEDEETEEFEEIEAVEETQVYQEIEAAEEAEAMEEYEAAAEEEQFKEPQGFEEEEEAFTNEEETISPIEEVIAKELGGRTIDIPQEELQETLQSMNMQQADEYSEDMEYESDEEEMYAEEETYLEQEEYTEDADYYEEPDEYGEYDVMEETAEEEPDVLRTQEISMNTEEINNLPDKIIEATKKETKAAKREEIREFTPEEKELFENFSVTKKIRKQIIFALDTMSLAAYTGNVLITGEPGLGTVRLAKNLIHEYQAMDANFSGRVAKITGEKLNLRDLKEVFDKLKNGAIIIEKANGLTEETLYRLAGLLNQEELGIIVIMEDTRKEITKLLEKQAMVADYFNIRIDLMEMDNNALVAYAKNYAQALEYSIDELGTLALYTRIANSQSGNHVVTKDEVREIVDEAIWKSRKFKIKNFVDVLFSKRYDSEDMIVLKERDFI